MLGCTEYSLPELRVHMEGQQLRHDPNPVYLGVTLDRTLSYRQHLTKTAGKLQSRNNLLMKLAGSSWGANANTLRSSALALCYSVAEYCCPVWQRSTHVSLVDAQLHSSMRLISGTIRSTPLPWLPVLTSIEPPALQRRDATDKLIMQAECHRDSSNPVFKVTVFLKSNISKMVYLRDNVSIKH